MSESFKDSKGTSSGGTTPSKSTGEDSDCGVHRERRQRLRPLETWNSSKSRKKVRKLRREHSSRQIGRRERSGPLISMSRECIEEGTICTIRSREKNPPTVGSGEDAQSLASGKERRKVPKGVEASGYRCS
jgi:hypothetical protein